MKKVLVFKGISPCVIDHLEAAGCDVVVNSQAAPTDFTQYGETLDGILLMMHPMTDAMFKQMPNLKIIARHGVGYDNIDLDAATANGIAVTNTPGANTTSVAETAVMHMLMAGRFFYQHRQKMVGEGDLNYLRAHHGQEVTAKTVGIIGFGSIGQKVDELLTGFNVNVLAYARHDKPVKNGRMATLDEIYAQSDFVIMALPSNKETYHMINADTLSQMKSNAVLINIARGAVVDEEALATALETGVIAGAGLDVTEVEPLPRESRLLALPNVFLTPHIAAFSQEAMDAVGLAAADEILRTFKGDPLVAQVNS